MKEKVGDHVMLEPRSIGTGVREKFGSVWLTASLLRSCDRLTPRLKVPQSYCLEKLTRLESVAVCTNGSTELRSTTRELVA